MLGHRLRRFPNIRAALAKRFMFDGILVNFIQYTSWMFHGRGISGKFIIIQFNIFLPALVSKAMMRWPVTWTFFSFFFVVFSTLIMRGEETNLL